jgi:hypothetical protein
MQQLIQQHLLRAQQRMKRQADKHRSDREFAVGEWVYLRLQPYIQTSVAQRSSQKLSFRFFGPYKILQRVGKVAYKLQLPASSQIHPVVHVSQLKKALRADEDASIDLPVLSLEDAAPSTPARFVEERFIRTGSKLIPQVKVSWQGLPDDFHTWEEIHALHRCYPTAPAWGHAGSLGGGIVTTFLKSEQQRMKQRQEKRHRRAAKRLTRAHRAVNAQDRPIDTQPMTSAPAGE